MRSSYLLLLILFNFLWSAALAIYKALEGHLSRGSIVTLRFGIAAVCVLLCWPLYRGKSPRGWDLVKTAIMGIIVFMLGHRIQTMGVQLGTAGNASVLMGCEPLVTSVAAALFLREHIGFRQWIGFAMGMLGVALLNGLFGTGFKWEGLGASLIFVSCFICEAVFSIMGKPLMERSDKMKILALGLLFGTIANLLVDGPQTFAEARHLPLHFWWLIAYMAVICTAIGYAFWFVVIEETDVNIVALTIFAQPVAGLFFATLWLHEPLHWGHLWGSLAIITGLVVGLSRTVKPA